MRVKNAILVIALIVSAMATTQAQGLSFGISAATNNSKYRIYGMDDAIENQIGFRTGATLEVKLPLVSITPEIWYTQSRFDIVDTSILGARSSVRNNVIEIPVVAGVNFSFLQIEAGPQFVIYDKTTARFSEDTSNIDLGSLHTPIGYIVGAKVTILKAITIGARFNGQVNKNYEGLNIGGESYDLRNYSFSVSLGLKL